MRTWREVVYLGRGGKTLHLGAGQEPGPWLSPRRQLECSGHSQKHAHRQMSLRGPYQEHGQPEAEVRLRGSAEACVSGGFSPGCSCRAGGLAFLVLF